VCTPRSYLREYYFNLGDDGAPEERQRQLQRLSQLLAGLGVDIAAEAAERGLGAAAEGQADTAAAAQQVGRGGAMEEPGQVLFKQCHTVSHSVSPLA
jgi:hypothetical protein